MILQNLKLLVELYYRPYRAMSGILDQGSLAFALVVASVTAFAARGALVSLFAALAAVVLVVVPVALVIIALWDSLGSLSVVLHRDTIPVLVCALMGWTAAVAPAAALAAGLRIPLGQVVDLCYIVSAIYFWFLCACGLRTVTGTTLVRGLVATAAACAAVIPGSFLYMAVGPFLLSPWVLFYGWMFFGGSASGLFAGLKGRQRQRQYLESLTLNPRDADAHYQLGLIYQDRRQYAEALARFDKAIEIDRSEAWPYYQSGRVLGAMGRWEEALARFQAAAALDDKLSLSDVWRETGVAHFSLGQYDKAHEALAKFVERRPYDAEGLVWYGRVLAKLGKTAEAKDACRQAIEAVETMPPQRRGKVRHWGREAKRELGAIR